MPELIVMVLHGDEDVFPRWRNRRPTARMHLAADQDLFDLAILYRSHFMHCVFVVHEDGQVDE